MKKGSFVADTFEQLAELGQSGKKAIKPLTQLPEKMLEGVFGVKETSGHTPLDFKKLQDRYGDQDMKKTNALRSRLFQLVKSGEEISATQKRQENAERKRREAFPEHKKKQEQPFAIPKGKIRRSIFSPKKMAKREQAEVRPAAGKQ